MAGSKLVDDELGELAKPLLPERPPQRTLAPPGQPPDSAHGDCVRAGDRGDRPLVSSQPGCSGVTAWRQLQEWQRAGEWELPHRELLRHLNTAVRIGRGRWWTQDTSRLRPGPNGVRSMMPYLGLLLVLPGLPLHPFLLDCHCRRLRSRLLGFQDRFSHQIARNPAAASGTTTQTLGCHWRNASTIVGVLPAT